MVLVAVVLVAATLALVAAVGLVARDPDRLVGWLRAGGITVTKVATRFINWFDRSVKKAAGGRLFAAIGGLAKRVLPDREHDAWVGGRAPPFDASRRSGQDAEVVEPVGVDGTGDAHMESGRLVGTHDIESLLCADQDVPLMSAALMSARFPVVSPTGRITQCATDEQASGVSVFTSDGGQLDPSAALTATQLWEAYEPYVVEYNRRSPNACIAPVLIHMENGFDADLAMTSSAPPNEWVDPVLWSLTDAKTGLVGNARQRMALEFSEPMAGPRAAMTLVDTSAGYGQSADTLSRVAYIRTRAHPGSSAPLGWTLSHTTLQDLAQQLGQNRAEFTRVHQWLSGDIACEPIPRSG